MPLTRDQAIEIARRAALAQETRQPATHGYLPTPTNVSSWTPHDWVVDALIEASAGPPGTLHHELYSVIDRWIAATAPRMRDELDYAVLKITLDDPGGDDDGTLHVDYRVEEETSFTSERWNHGGGRVLGVEY
jgi:hypothetical protein